MRRRRGVVLRNRSAGGIQRLFSWAVHPVRGGGEVLCGAHGPKPIQWRNPRRESILRVYDIQRGVIVKAGTNSRTAGALCAIAALCVAFVISCDGGEHDADHVIDRMIKAHGGSEKIELIQDYVGRGFMKNLASTSVSQSDPFDIYRRGPLFKNRIMKLRGGKAVDVGLTIYDGREGYQWQYSTGKQSVPTWQFDIMRYLFPRVLGWAQRMDRPGEIVTGEHEYYVERVRYINGDNIVTIGVDDRTWLLKDVRITSVSDSAFSFSEAYDNYREVDGVPFPGRFKGKYRDMPYYEYFIPVIEYDVELPDSVFAVTADDTIDIFHPDTTEQSP